LEKFIKTRTAIGFAGFLLSIARAIIGGGGRTLRRGAKIRRNKRRIVARQLLFYLRKDRGEAKVANTRPFPLQFFFAVIFYRDQG